MLDWDNKSINNDMCTGLEFNSCYNLVEGVNSSPVLIPVYSILTLRIRHLLPAPPGTLVCRPVVVILKHFR
jgi:hypothetical protein